MVVNRWLAFDMRILLTLLLVLVCRVGFTAELLVQAVDSPFESGAKTGDIIVVRPDGWQWGTSECLPQYVVIKLPGVTEEYAKKYEEALTEQVAREPLVSEAPIKGEVIKEGMAEAEAPIEMESKIVRARKYSVPVSDVEAMKAQSLSVAVKSPSYFVAEKSLVVEKEAVMQAELMKEAIVE
jgi:hypothetical protein